MVCVCVCTYGVMKVSIMVRICVCTHEGMKVFMYGVYVYVCMKVFMFGVHMCMFV